MGSLPFSLYLSDNGTLSVTSPTGSVITALAPYLPAERLGTTVVVVTAAVSLACVLLLLVVLGIFMIRKRTSHAKHFFVKTHAAVYFACLLVAAAIQALGSFMSVKWVEQDGVTLGSYCSTQGAIKNAGNLAVSLWTLTLAVHTFLVLFLRWKIRDYALYVTLFGIWFLVGLLVLLGPAAIQRPDKGPYFGISGYWCWIADPYPGARIGMEYLWLLGSAGLSFVFYSLTFLRLRGNLVIEKGKVSWRRIESENSWKYLIGRDTTDIQMTQVAKGMLGFPILFTVTVLPIAVCRFIAWSGGEISMEATIFSDAVFSLTGVFDLILFMTTRSLLPEDGFRWWVAPRPHVSVTEVEKLEYGVQQYNVQDFASVHGFSEVYQREAEGGMATLPPRTSASLGKVATAGTKEGTETAASAGAGAATIPSRPTRPASLTLSPSSPGGPVPASPAAWDDIDLGRRVSPARNEFVDPAPLRRREERDTRYTTFSLSAYDYRDEEEDAPPVPPVPVPVSMPSPRPRLVRSRSARTSRVVER